MGRVKLTDCILVHEYSSKLVVRVIVEAVSWQMQKKKLSSADVWVSKSIMIWIRSLRQYLTVVRRNFK